MSKLRNSSSRIPEPGLVLGLGGEMELSRQFRNILFHFKQIWGMGEFGGAKCGAIRLTLTQYRISIGDRCKLSISMKHSTCIM